MANPFANWWTCQQYPMADIAAQLAATADPLAATADPMATTEDQMADIAAQLAATADPMATTEDRMADIAAQLAATADPLAATAVPHASATLFAEVDDLLAQQGNLGDMGLPALDGSLFPEESAMKAIAEPAAAAATPTAAAAAAAAKDDQNKFDNVIARTQPNVEGFVHAGFATDVAAGIAKDVAILAEFGVPAIEVQHLVDVIMTMTVTEWNKLWKLWILEQHHRATSASFKKGIVAISFPEMVLCSARYLRLMQVLCMPALTTAMRTKLKCWCNRIAQRNNVRMGVLTRCHGGKLSHLREYWEHNSHTSDQLSAHRNAVSKGIRAAIRAATQAQRRADDEEQPC
jgi:hypothetical protein